MSPSYRTGAPVSSRWDGDFLLLHRTPKHAFTSKPLPLRLLGKEKTDLDSKVGGSTYLSKAGSIHLSGIGQVKNADEHHVHQSYDKGDLHCVTQSADVLHL